VPLFLSDPNTELYVLLRANSQEHLENRLKDLLSFLQIDADDRNIQGRIKPLMGNTSIPKLGLDIATYDGLAKKIRCIVHSAASVRMDLPLAEARASSVVAAKHIIEFAFSCQANGALEKLEVVSTVGVAGRQQGRILEQPLKEKRAFHTTYEQAKAEAEELFFDASGRGLPITIHRPSMVVGDSETGRVIHRQVFYHLCQFLSGKKTHGMLPTMAGARLDIIPVNYVAKAIYLSSRNLDTAGHIFHLCSGPTQSMQLTDLAARLQEMYSKRNENLPQITYWPLCLFRVVLFLLILISDSKRKRALRSLYFFLLYVSDHQIFDNNVTDSYFSSLGLRIPEIASYLSKVV
jgi:thioester reductase-like protein